MTKRVRTYFVDLPSVGQVKVECETVKKLIENLELSLRDAVNAGVSDPHTANELVHHLEASLAAAYRWHSETLMNQALLNARNC